MSIAIKNKYYKYLIVFITLTYAIILTYFFSQHITDFDNKIDGSWEYSLGSLRSSDQHIGSNIFFTYGPLSEKVITSVNVNDSFLNYIASVMLYMVLLVLNSWVFFKFSKKILSQKNASFKLLYISTLISVVFAITSIESFFYLTLLLTIYVASEEDNYYKKISLLIGIFLFSLYKFNFTLPALVLSPIIFIDNLTIKGIVKSLYKWIPCIFIYVLMYLLLTNLFNLSGFVEYLYLGLQSSIAYSEFMGLPFKENLNIVIFYGLIAVTNLAVFIWYLYAKKSKFVKIINDKFVLTSIAYFFILLLTFKHGVVRSDIHLLSFTPFIYLVFSYLVLVIILLHPKSKIFRKNNKNFKILLGISVVVFFLINTAIVSFVQYRNIQGVNKLAVGLKSHLIYKTNLLSGVINNNQLNYFSFNQKKLESNNYLNQYNATIKEAKEYLLNSSNQSKLIFYGNTTFIAEVLKNDFNIQYMPYLQIYAAFPPNILDKIYINYLDNNPEHLVFAEELEPSIDERIPSHELNNFFQYLIHNYKIEFVNKQKNQFILKRYNNSHEVCSYISSTNSIDDEAIHTPNIKISNNEYIKMRVENNNIIDSIVDLGLSTLIKKPIMTIGLINENGKFERRTTKSTLKHGIAIKPLYQSLGDLAADQPYVFNSIVIYDDFATQNNYNIVFEKCIF